MNLLESYNLLKGNRNLFLGFYGGGNYGDELLMEILMNYNEKNKINGTFLFLNRVDYKKFHKTFKFSNIIFPKSFVIESIKSKNIVFGGGGLFSEDSSIKHTLILLYLFILRFVFFKKIYFYGLGFYNNSKYLILNRFLIKLISNQIFVRDNSSLNVLGHKSNIFLDKDLSFILKDNNFGYLYQNNNLLPNNIIINDFILFSVRNNHLDKKKNFENVIYNFIKSNDNKNFVFWEMGIDSFNKYSKLKNVYILKNTNPLNIFYFLERNKQKIKLITPQFHGIITAELLGIKYLPIYYADKGKDILNNFGFKGIKVSNVTYEDIENFVNNK